MRGLTRGLTLVVLTRLALVAPVAGQDEGHEHGHDHVHQDGIHSHRGPGPHFIDAFFTENAYVERKLRPDLFYAHGDEADMLIAQLEVEWAVLRSASLVVHAPFLRVDPAEGASESGLGDARVGLKVAPLNNRRRLILATGVDLQIPTGDEARGLGEAHGAAEPFLLAWLPFGRDRRWLLQAGTHLEIPFDGEADRHAESSVALSWTSPIGLSPILEGIVEYGVEGEDPAFALAPEFRYEFAESWELGAGVLLPVGGPHEDDYTVVAGLIRHFEMPWR